MSYTIEILGIDRRNKGALLMLESCCDMIRGRYPDARIAISFRFDPKLRLRYGLWTALPREKLQPGFAAAWERIPKSVRRIGAIVRRSEIDVVLDASGFAYGDAWPTQKLEYRLAKTILERRKGCKVILLPQAFGPFSSAAAQRLIAQALPKADLVFARDKQSFDYLWQITGGAGENVRLAPDFSNLLTAPPIADGALANGYWIVPNTKVLEHEGTQSASNYLRFLERSVDRMREHGLAPRVLIHEGKKDEAVALRLNGMLATPVDLCRPQGALEAKAILGRASGVISSRYHALVSALAAGVPSLACGWSHKYDALMEDYALEGCTVDLAKPDEWDAKIGRIIDLSRDPVARENLRTAAGIEKEKSRQMWETVFDTIEGPGR